MKRITLLMFAVCFVCVQGYSQKSSAPEAVKSKFTHLYPKAEKVKWENEKNTYEAHFELNREEMSATFEANGNMIEAEKEIPLSALPAGAAEYAAKNYPGQKIKEAAEITDANGIVTYEAEMKDGDLIFDKAGQMVKFNKKESKKEKQKG